MSDRTHDESHRPDILNVSPYLLRPLRTYEQALADIEARTARKNNVTSFAVAHHTRLRASRNRAAA